MNHLILFPTSCRFFERSASVLRLHRVRLGILKLKYNAFFNLSIHLFNMNLYERSFCL